MFSWHDCWCRGCYWHLVAFLEVRHAVKHPSIQRTAPQLGGITTKVKKPCSRAQRGNRHFEACQVLHHGVMEAVTNCKVHILKTINIKIFINLCRLKRGYMQVNFNLLLISLQPWLQCSFTDKDGAFQSSRSPYVCVCMRAHTCVYAHRHTDTYSYTCIGKKIYFLVNLFILTVLSLGCYAAFSLLWLLLLRSTGSRACGLL